MSGTVGWLDEKFRVVLWLRLPDVDGRRLDRLPRRYRALHVSLPGYRHSISTAALASLLVACTYRYREIAERKRMQLIGRWLSLVLCTCIGLVPVTVAAFLYPTSWSAVGRMSPPAASAATADADADAPSTSKPIHIAYAGNSMIYFHDTPRFFANLAI